MNEMKFTTILLLLVAFALCGLLIGRLINKVELDEIGQLTCHKLFSTLEYKIVSDRLFCKVDYKWVEVKGEIE